MRFLPCAAAVLAAVTTATAQQDIGREIEAAREIHVVGLPPVSASGRAVGDVHGTPITLGQLLDEVIVRYAIPVRDVLARQKAMAMEAAHRGVRPDEAGFIKEAVRFRERTGGGKPLPEALRAQRLSWTRFEQLMRLNAAVAAMVAADTGSTDPGGEKGRDWARKIQSRYKVVTDPAVLGRDVYARVRGRWSLRKLLANHLAQKTPLTLRRSDDTDAPLVFDQLNWGLRATVKDVPATETTAQGLQPGTVSLRALLARWQPGAWRVVDPSKGTPPGVILVAPADRPFPVYRLVSTDVRIDAEITGHDLLQARFPDLKLRHLDEALEHRGRLIAFEAAMKERQITVRETRVARRLAAERKKYEKAPFSWERAIQMVGRNVYLEIRRFRQADALDQILGTGVSVPVLKAYHEAHIEHFGRATVTASHILVSEADPVTGRVDYARAKKIIDEAYGRLVKGEKFIDMVQHYSQDPASKRRGGDVGLFTLVSAYDPEFCRLAFALQEGEISPPVKTRRGYHIIYCRQKTPADRKAHPFEKVREEVKEDRQEDLRRRWLEEHIYRGLKVSSNIDEVMEDYGFGRTL